MTSKKRSNRFRERLKKTVSEEKRDVAERFSRAEVALGDSQPEAGRHKKKKRRKTVVRDTFSLPEEDYAIIEEIRQRLIREHAIVKNKSEVLRAGLKLLQALDSETLLEVAEQVESLKPGRPAQDK